MREPSEREVLLVIVTLAAFLLALAGVEMLVNMDPNPLAGCVCAAIGGTWLLLMWIANSQMGEELRKDVTRLKEVIECLR